MYIATRRLTLSGQIFSPGDEVPKEVLTHELEVIYLSRAFLTPLGGLESLDEDIRAEVMELMG